MSAVESYNAGREDFAALLEESFGKSDALEGSVIKGKVVAIEKDMAIIDVGLKTEGRVALKARLLDSHQLTDYQRIEQLLAMDSLGARKPSELLAHMLELCPAGEETSKFFAFHFLHRLPQELRIMLGEDDHQEVHELAKKADRLWAIHGHRQHGAVAAVATPDPGSAVNAIRGAPGGSRRGRGGQQRGNERHGSRCGPCGRDQRVVGTLQVMEVGLQLRQVQAWPGCLRCNRNGLLQQWLCFGARAVGNAGFGLLAKVVRQATIEASLAAGLQASRDFCCVLPVA